MTLHVNVMCNLASVATSKANQVHTMSVLVTLTPILMQ